MRICCISDLHGNLPKLPECSLLIIAGDICPIRSHDLFFQRLWLEDNFVPWLQKQPFEFAVMVWGNHDFIGEKTPELVPQLPDNVKLLQDDITEFRGLKIFATPFQLAFNNWAFNTTEEELARKYAHIPDDTDIIVSHGPPYGYGDLAPSNNFKGQSEHVGSPSLLERIREIKPKLVAYGHIHAGRGVYHFENSVLANCTLVTEAYKMKYKPMLFELEDGEIKEV